MIGTLIASVLFLWAVGNGYRNYLLNVENEEPPTKTE
jgi:hypothetical protein